MDFYIAPKMLTEHPYVKVGIFLLRQVKDHRKKSLNAEMGISSTARVQCYLLHLNPIAYLCNLITIKYDLPVGIYHLDRNNQTIELISTESGSLSITLRSVANDNLEYRELLGKGGKDLMHMMGEDGTICLVITEKQNKTGATIIQGLDELTRMYHNGYHGEVETYYLDGAKKELGTQTPHTTTAKKMENGVPAYHSYPSFQLRTKKLNEIRTMGIDPYPHRYRPTHQIAPLQERFAEMVVGNSEEGKEGITEKGSIAGRLVLFRAMGKNAFGQIQDDTGVMQVMFNKDKTQVTGLVPQDTALKFIEKKIDLGDILGVEGHFFRTQKGELTLFAKEVTLLCKALLPLPDKHGGLSDKGICYRKRWLDLITNPASVNRLKTRSFLISKTREFFEKEGFMEVETPVLQNSYGGAQARPFTAQLHALNQKMYLRIAIEIGLKKLIVGGLSKVFEIGKVYRNEGIDRTHNPEFTMLESYAAYWDYHDVMSFTEHLFAHLAQQLYGTTAIGMRQDKEGNSHLIDLKPPWHRLSMKEAIQRYAQIDLDTLSDEEIQNKLAGNIDHKLLQHASRGTLIAQLFETFVEHHLIQPHHIIDHPIETTPLCKLHRNPKLRKEQFVERFESFILGYEFCNAYSELNDPQLQRKLFEQQNTMRKEGNHECNPIDEEFIEAICQGMPPTGGLGIGIDRLVMLFTDAFSIRDVLYFPLMRLED